LFKKNASITERANAALASLQRNAYAMGMLRSRLESRVSFIINEKGGVGSCQELSRVLELVKNGELILHEISDKIESARFLEEFATIMDSAASSVSEIRDDLEQIVPAAEVALEEIHNAISKMSVGLPDDLRQEILLEAAAAVTVGKTSVEEQEKEEKPERVPA
jgi:hypothetical protein